VRALPPSAAVIWWGLFGFRVGLGVLSLRGLWAMRADGWGALLLSGSVAYLLLLPGPIAHDRFLLPVLPALLPLSALGLSAAAQDSA
jgi:hypothetical protein